MPKIKVSELFYSIQGEGRYMGVPSVFLRTFGCNFTCGGFGMPRGELSEERLKVNPAAFKEYNGLPLVNTGCDSYASWDPRFKHLSPMIETDGIAERIVELLPNKSWDNEHLIITGGEPLLGWQRAYPALLEHPKMKGLQELTFETNGTQALSEELKAYLESWTYDKYRCGTSKLRGWNKLTFSVSAKLPVSGESWDKAIKPEVVVEYEKYGYTFLKFVVATEQDVEDAERAVNEYRKAGFYGPVYIMPVGGVESVYDLNSKKVALMAMERGWRYSDRLQVPLFQNAWAT